MTHDQLMTLCSTGGFAVAYVLGVLIEFFTRRPQTVMIPSEDGKSVTAKEVYKGADLGCLTFVAAVGMAVCGVWFLCELIPG